MTNPVGSLPRQLLQQVIFLGIVQGIYLHMDNKIQA